LGGHLGLAVEKFHIGFPVGASETVPKGSELAIVVVEVQMVHGMTSSTVNYRRVRDVFAVMNQDGPDVDESEQHQIGELVQREDERENVVGNALRVAIKRVESVAGERSRHDPFVVRLVEMTIDERMVKTAVNPIDAAIREHEEQRELDDDVPPSVCLDAHVQPRVSLDFGVEKWSGEDGHYRERAQGLDDLLSDLVLEELGVLERILVEDENIREGREEEVDHASKQPCYQKESKNQAKVVTSLKPGHVCILGRLPVEVLRYRVQFDRPSVILGYSGIERALPGKRCSV